MVLSEQSRHELYLRLEEALGPESAATLMEHLPPVGCADMATKRDLDAVSANAKRDLDAAFAGLKHDIETRSASVKHDIDALELRLRADMFEAINGAITSQTRRILFGLIGSNLTVVALMLVAIGVR